MTNNDMIQAQHLEHLDRIETADGVAHTINNTRMIDEKRYRITTLEGRVIIAQATDCFHLHPDTGV